MTRDEAIELLRSGSEGVLQWNRWRGGGAETLDLCGIDFRDCDLSLPDRQGVQLGRCDLTSARLDRANLSGAFLHSCRFVSANLEGAILDGADASAADFSAANLHGASLRGTRLVSAKFIGTYVNRMVLEGAEFGGTTFIIPRSLDGPSDIIGLDSIKHRGQSWVGVATILSFRDELPEIFLRGCGLRDEEIVYFRSVVGKPIRFYTCFISYSTADEDFASRLHNDFQAAGIRCWKWDHDARTGRSLWGEINEAIRVHDKVVLIASENSLKSPAVKREIERAVQEEDRRAGDKEAGKYEGDIDVLFPVRIDDYVLNDWQDDRKADVIKKVIADARNWDKDPAVYARVRDRLINDLKPN